MTKEYFELGPSESRIADMAATVFAGFAAQGSYGEAAEDELIRRSVRIALKLARATDDAVQDAEEGTEAGGLGGSFFQ